MPKITCPECFNVNYRDKQYLGNSVICDCGYRIWINESAYHNWCYQKIIDTNNTLKREHIFNVTREQREQEQHEKENFKSDIVPDQSFLEYYESMKKKKELPTDNKKRGYTKLPKA